MRCYQGPKATYWHSPSRETLLQLLGSSIPSTYVTIADESITQAYGVTNNSLLVNILRHPLDTHHNLHIMDIRIPVQPQIILFLKRPLHSSWVVTIHWHTLWIPAQMTLLLCPWRRHHHIPRRTACVCSKSYCNSYWPQKISTKKKGFNPPWQSRPGILTKTTTTKTILWMAKS